VGLGNPGREHADSRHNVGFMVADELLARWSLGAARQRYRGRFREGRVERSDAGAPGERVRRRVALLWPLTYMNDAGSSVGPARGALRLALEQVIVVHDEIDLPFGEVRTRIGGGLAGHNGLRSVCRGLGGEGFRRVRAGVGRPDSTDPEIVSAWVLASFREPHAEVAALIARACDAVEGIVFGSD
jgi:peptidyl-tRNA hydrolase, PTH1 family